MYENTCCVYNAANRSPDWWCNYLEVGLVVYLEVGRMPSQGHSNSYMAAFFSPQRHPLVALITPCLLIGPSPYQTLLAMVTPHLLSGPSHSILCHPTSIEWS